MPWKKQEHMDQRSEFVLKALKTDNFRALCAEYGISAKTGYKLAGADVALWLWTGMRTDGKKTAFPPVLNGFDAGTMSFGPVHPHNLRAGRGSRSVLLPLPPNVAKRVTVKT